MSGPVGLVPVLGVIASSVDAFLICNVNYYFISEPRILYDVCYEPAADFSLLLILSDLDVRLLSYLWSPIFTLSYHESAADSSPFLTLMKDCHGDSTLKEG